MLYRNAECYIEMLYCYIAFFSYEMLPPKKKLIAVLLRSVPKIPAKIYKSFKKSLFL